MTNPLQALYEAPQTPEWRAGIQQIPATARKPEFDGLPWQTVVGALNRATGGQWWHETTIHDRYVWVSITVPDQNGVLITRGSLSTIKDAVAGGGIPSLETAERQAFKRAASYFGLHLAPDEDDSNDRPAAPARRPAPPAAAPAAQPQPQQPAPPAAPQREHVPGECDHCGSPVKGNYKTCYACNLVPEREPGVCVTCGQPAKPEYVQCWGCKDDYPITRNSLENVNYTTESQPGPAPAQAQAQADPLAPQMPDAVWHQIQSCKTMWDFVQLLQSGESWDDAWKLQAFQAAVYRARECGIGWNRDSKEWFHLPQDDENDMPF